MKSKDTIRSIFHSRWVSGISDSISTKSIAICLLWCPIILHPPLWLFYHRRGEFATLSTGSILDGTLGMADKQSRSNISTNETKKAAVRSHREPNGGLSSYSLSFLSLGVRATPDRKIDGAHLKNVASRGAKLKFWKIEFLQLFHYKSGTLYVKTSHFRAAFIALHLSSTHFGANDVTRTHNRWLLIRVRC